ncbi:methionine--tRNA ligase [Gracilinema caldarium]|uniref:methionine--tRNA ligase n=1 Tax=Gracilinema caldarium TaxID=215591 RepID=UPI0026F0D7BF|nr:methionine--tRNA ligase [Gracilinema caldarium]
MKRRLVTSALPYVNNVPHLGNLIQVLSADVFARFCRLRGYDTLYVCGTDEYGTATETRAAEEGISPRELCDRYHALHRDIYQWFNIAFDKFGRTSTPIQTEVVQDIFKKLDAQGFIVERSIEQLYCEQCGRFLADRYVRGVCPHCGYNDARGDQCEQCGKLLEPTELKESRCSTCGSQPKLKSTKHLYIDLPRIKERLEAWITEASVKGFWANNAIQMTNAWIRDGLKERAITRDLKWGIPVPKAGFEDKVFYVWFDAPIGYISITGNLAADRGQDWRAFVQDWWKNPDEVELFQFIGKDNIPFHTVIFPSSLLGTGEKWTMLHHMSSTEYLNYESGKFSKSKGIGVFGSDAMESGIPADVWRFYIFYNRPEKADALFTWKDFQEKVNGELIGNLGNLVNRTLSFVSRYYDGKVPEGKPDSEFWKTVQAYEQTILEKLDKAELRDAFRTVFELSSFANKTFQDGEPWKTRKEDPARAASLIRDLCYVVRDLAILIHPYIPGSAEKLASFFGLTIGKGGLSCKDLGTLTGLEAVHNPEVLFNKLEDDLVQTLRDRYSGSQKERHDREKGQNMDTTSKATITSTVAHSEADKPLPEISENLAHKFASMVDLRVAKITSIERHPKADKLYIETLDVGGGETRTIVSGLVPYYKEEELLGKHIVLVYNLKPAKLRGVESKGMLLAASAHNSDGTESVEVLDAGFAEPGTRIQVGHIALPVPPAEIDIDTFFSMPIVAENGTILVDKEPLICNGKPLATQRVLQGEVG